MLDELGPFDEKRTQFEYERALDLERELGKLPLSTSAREQAAIHYELSLVLKDLVHTYSQPVFHRHALKHATQATELAPKSARYWINRGGREDIPAREIGCYTRALELGDCRADAYGERGKAFVELNCITAALQDFRRAGQGADGLEWPAQQIPELERRLEAPDPEGKRVTGDADELAAAFAISLHDPDLDPEGDEPALENDSFGPWLVAFIVLALIGLVARLSTI